VTTAIPIIVDGIDERSDAFTRATDRAEIRITGPFTREMSNGYWQAYVDANVLLTSRYDGKAKNAYDLLKYAGLFYAAMDCAVGVWNYGGEAGDYVESQAASHVFLGCLNVRPGQAVRVVNFGQVDPVVKVKQAEVEARYVIELYE